MRRCERRVSGGEHRAGLEYLLWRASVADCHLKRNVTADGSIKWPPAWQSLFKLTDGASRRPFKYC